MIFRFRYWKVGKFQVKLTCFTDGHVIASKWIQSNVISSQLSPYIDSVLYTVCLIWANSEHYNTPSRVIVILQEICNLLIEMVLF